MAIEHQEMLSNVLKTEIDTNREQVSELRKKVETITDRVNITNNIGTINNIQFNLHDHMPAITDERVKMTILNLLTLSAQHPEKTIDNAFIQECVMNSLGDSFYMTDAKRGSIYWKDGRLENPKVKYDKHGTKLGQRFQAIASTDPVQTEVAKRITNNEHKNKEIIAHNRHLQKLFFQDVDIDTSLPMKNAEKMMAIHSENNILHNLSSGVVVDGKLLTDCAFDKDQLETMLVRKTITPMQRCIRDFLKSSDALQQLKNDLTEYVQTHHDEHASVDVILQQAKSSMMEWVEHFF